MKISDVTKDDGRTFAILMNLFKAARWNNMSEEDAAHLATTKQWMQGLALQMADQLKTKGAEISSPSSVVKSSNPAPTNFKIKGMGMTSSPRSKKKK